MSCVDFLIPRQYVLLNEEYANHSFRFHLYFCRESIQPSEVNSEAETSVQKKYVSKFVKIKPRSTCLDVSVIRTACEAHARDFAKRCFCFKGSTRCRQRGVASRGRVRSRGVRRLFVARRNRS